MSYYGPRKEPGSMLKKYSSPKKSENSKWREEREGMSNEHLKLIRQLPCCIPGCDRHPGGQAHHLKDVKGERGAGLRSTDRRTVPMCNDHHINGVERVGSKKETQWFAERGIDSKGLAFALWTNNKNLKRMTAIVETHKELAGKK